MIRNLVNLKKKFDLFVDKWQPKVIADDKIVTKVIAEKKWCLSASAECTTIELLVRV